MTDPELEHQSFGLSGRSLSFALFGKYVGLTIYGLWATVVEVPTFVTVGSSFFATGWALTVTVFAALAAYGVWRTWTTGRFRLEKTMTAAFILTFVGYSFALIYRAIVTEDSGSLPLSVIPVVVCILPAIRYYSLVSRRFNFKRRNNA